MTNDIKTQLNSIIERAVLEAIQVMRDAVTEAINTPYVPTAAKKKAKKAPPKKKSAKKKPKPKTVTELRAGTQGANVVDMLRATSGAATMDQIRAQVSGSPQSLAKTVQDLVANGHIKRVARGVYALP